MKKQEDTFLRKKQKKKSKQSYHNDTSEVEIGRGIELFE